jgi:hypothetical protein
MHGMIGWLSDLGDTTFSSSARQAQPGELLTFTLTIQKVETAPTGPVTATNYLPAGLELWQPSLPPDVVYDATTRMLQWHGRIESGATYTLSYQARISPLLPDGAQLENRVTLRYQRHALQFDRVATVWVNAPNLAPSAITAEAFAPHPYQFVWYTVTVQNESWVAAPTATAVLHIPPTLYPLTATLQASSGHATLHHRQLTWHGDAPGHTAVTISILTWRPMRTGYDWLAATATIDDAATRPLVRTAVTHLPPYTRYLPRIWHN